MKVRHLRKQKQYQMGWVIFNRSEEISAWDDYFHGTLLLKDTK